MRKAANLVRTTTHRPPAQQSMLKLTRKLLTKQGLAWMLALVTGHQPLQARSPPLLKHVLPYLMARVQKLRNRQKKKESRGSLLLALPYKTPLR